MSSVYEMTEVYFAKKITEHGPTAKGVDWNGEESQYVRFAQLAKVLENDERSHISLNDLGCGYGEMFNFLKEKYTQYIEYHGYDLCQKMIDAACERFPSEVQAYFYKVDMGDVMRTSDYSVASGIFNIQIGADNDWQKHILETLQQMNNSSRKGFSFNCLTKYSDKEYMKDYLYYADPCDLFDYCKRNFSKNVAILHDYELFEFTIVVRK